MQKLLGTPNRAGNSAAPRPHRLTFPWHASSCSQQAPQGHTSMASYWHAPLQLYKIWDVAGLDIDQPPSAQPPEGGSAAPIFGSNRPRSLLRRPASAPCTPALLSTYTRLRLPPPLTFSLARISPPSTPPHHASTHSDHADLHTRTCSWSHPCSNTWIHLCTHMAVPVSTPVNACQCLSLSLSLSLSLPPSPPTCPSISNPPPRPTLRHSLRPSPPPLASSSLLSFRALRLFTFHVLLTSSRMFAPRSHVTVPIRAPNYNH